jgi:hypothetical protein
MTWFTAQSVSVNNGATIVSVVNATSDDIAIAQEFGGLIIGNNPPVEIKRTFLDGSGNKRIELRQPWPYTNQTGQAAVAFPTDADLAEATRVLRAVGSDAVTFSESLAQVLSSTANSVTIATETSGDITVTPYAKLAADTQALIDANGSFGVPLYSSTSKNAARTLLGLKPQVTAAATLDLDFTKGDYTVYESAALSFQKKTLAQAVTTTRASSASVNTPFGVQTVGNNIARIEYNPVTGEPLGLLCEEQRTNLVLWAEALQTVVWTKTGVSVLVDQTIAPDGTLTADSVIENTDTSEHFIRQFVPAGATINTSSVYVKKLPTGAARSLRIRMGDNSGFIGSAHFNLTTKQFYSVTPTLTAKIEEFADGWFRCSVTTTNASSGVNVGAELYMVQEGQTGTQYAGDNTSGLYMWGAQFEAGSFPTSYIKTEGSQVTRVRDNIQRVITPSRSKTFYTSGRLLAGGFNRLMFAGQSSNYTSNFISLGITTASTNDIYISVTLAGSNVFPFTTRPFTQGAEIKVALTITPTRVAWFYNGELVQSVNGTFDVSVIDNAFFGGSNATYRKAIVSDFLEIPFAISDAEAIDLTRL